MSLCSWCNHWIWPWQKASPGKSLHFRCLIYVTRITRENQQQYLKEYQQRQAELRWEEEDRL